MPAIVMASAVLASEAPPIFPTPVSIEFLEGVFQADVKTVIAVPQNNEKLDIIAGFLARELGETLEAPNGSLRVVKEDDWTKQNQYALYLGYLDNADDAIKRAETTTAELPQKEGAYLLSVDRDGAVVLGRDAQGVYYGCLSLLQIYDGNEGGKFAYTKIVDYPYQYYRGMRVTPPRGKPRAGEISHDYFRNFLRLLSYFKLNHVWVQGTSWGLPLRRHPEMAWKDVLTINQAREFDECGRSHFLSMDGSLDWMWLYGSHKDLAELYPDETWENMRPEVKKKSRLNPCPSNPETWKILYETMDDVMELLSGDHFAIPLDEMYQEYHGSRWAVCPLCKGKAPVRLWAEFTDRLAAHIVEKGKIPIMSGGMLLREHQGWYKNIYQAIDMIDHRNKIVIYNWSEGHIRRGGMMVGGRRLRDPDLKTTSYFRAHGYKGVMHLLMDRWKGRPELREVNGRLDCYGGFVSYYHAMDYETMRRKGTIGSLVFSAQHLWSPDMPEMDSPQDKRLLRYGEAIAAAVLHHKSFIEAVGEAREVYRNAEIINATPLIPDRLFESTDDSLDLTVAERVSGVMRIELPAEEANPQQVFLFLDIKGWSGEKSGEILLNGHKVDLNTAGERQGEARNLSPFTVPAKWLKYGADKNVLRFTRRNEEGFKVAKAAIGIID